jgi:hypothetical protein
MVNSLLMISYVFVFTKLCLIVADCTLEPFAPLLLMPCACRYYHVLVSYMFRFEKRLRIVYIELRTIIDSYQGSHGSLEI